MLALFHSLQIILVVVDLGQHWLLHSHLKIWSRQSGVTLGTLRLSSHSKFIKIDRLVFETLGNPLSMGFEFWKFLQVQLLFKKSNFRFFIQNAERELCWIGGRRDTIWWKEGKNVLSELIWSLHFSCFFHFLGWISLCFCFCFPLVYFTQISMTA